jgi:biotin operon repressor
MLLSYAWHNDFCFPGQETLAKDMGVTDRSVRTYIKELETKGFLTIKQQGQGKPNIYHLDLAAIQGSLWMTSGRTSSSHGSRQSLNRPTWSSDQAGSETAYRPELADIVDKGIFDRWP